MSRILSVSSGRSDVAILNPVWQALVKTEGIELHILFTGMHCTPQAAGIDCPTTVTVHRGGADLGGDAACAAHAMAAILDDAGALYRETVPDIVLVIGDRLDMLPAAVATLPLNIPLAHLHGGEITEGAVDDRARHAITKLAHLHFVSCESAAQRLRAMGEEPWRIHVTGAPGLDTLMAAPELSRGDFVRDAGLEGIAGDLARLRLVTVHPETNAAHPLAPLEAVLAALDAQPAPTLFTSPNSDPGGAEARRRIETFVAARGWARFRETLGPVLYPNALRHAAVMIGNSSSGIIEAGLFGLPVIDVGARQKGRERGVNVATCEAEMGAVTRALAACDGAGRRYAPGSLYGDGQSGPRIAAILADPPARERLLLKQFGARTTPEPDTGATEHESRARWHLA